MIEIFNIRTKKAKKITFEQFMSEFIQWNENTRKVFRNRAFKSNSLEFENYKYTFDYMDYRLFLRQNDLVS